MSSLLVSLSSQAVCRLSAGCEQKYRPPVCVIHEKAGMWKATDVTHRRGGMSAIVRSSGHAAEQTRVASSNHTHARFWPVAANGRQASDENTEQNMELRRVARTARSTTIPQPGRQIHSTVFGARSSRAEHKGMRGGQEERETETRRVCGSVRWCSRAKNLIFFVPA